MSLLKHIPSDSDLMRLYWELSQIGADCVGDKVPWKYSLKSPKSKEELILLACEMLRYDPRLLSILIIYFLNHWKELNPMMLREGLLSLKAPQVLGVLKEFIFNYTQDDELKYFLEYITRGIKPVSPQLFFIGLFSVGSQRHELTSQKSLKQYMRWGFLGRERPVVNVMTKKAIGSYDMKTRQKIIVDISRSKENFSIKEYLETLDFSISRQQALYDLKHCKNIFLKGHGRGARWCPKK